MRPCASPRGTDWIAQQWQAALGAAGVGAADRRPESLGALHRGFADRDFDFAQQDREFWGGGWNPLLARILPMRLRPIEVKSGRAPLAHAGMADFAAAFKPPG